jgi:hypothetical protein
MSTWIVAQNSEVTLLSKIVALSISSDLGCIRSSLRSVGVRCRSRTRTSIEASIGKMTNLSTIETSRGRFS